MSGGQSRAKRVCVLPATTACVCVPVWVSCCCSRPNWEPALSLIIPYPLHPLCYNCCCTKAHSIICTALHCGHNPPNILRLRQGGDLKAGLPIFSSIQRKFPTENFDQRLTQSQPFSQGFFVIGSGRISEFTKCSRKAINPHQFPCKYWFNRKLSILCCCPLSMVLFFWVREEPQDCSGLH